MAAGSEEQLEIVSGLWGTPAGETYDHDGVHDQLKDRPALAARFAEEFNLPFVDLETTRGQFARVKSWTDRSLRRSRRRTYPPPGAGPLSDLDHLALVAEQVATQVWRRSDARPTTRER